MKHRDYYGLLAIIDKDHEDATARSVLTAWTIYRRPSTGHAKFLAQRFEIVKGNEEPIKTDRVLIFESVELLQVVRGAFRRLGLAPLPRATVGDADNVLETWL